MKATLTFDLDDRDDKMAHARCVKALDMAIALFSIREELYNRKLDRRRIKELIQEINLDDLIE